MLFSRMSAFKWPPVWYDPKSARGLACCQRTHLNSIRREKINVSSWLSERFFDRIPVFRH